MLQRIAAAQVRLHETRLLKRLHRFCVKLRVTSYLEELAMQFEPSDIIFLVVILSIAVMLINNGGGGGRRAPIRVY